MIRSPKHLVFVKKINKCIIRRESWTTKDDNQLKKAIKNFGFDWLSIAQTFPNRNQNQCSQRWKKLNRNNINLYFINKYSHKRNSFGVIEKTRSQFNFSILSVESGGQYQQISMEELLYNVGIDTQISWIQLQNSQCQKIKQFMKNIYYLVQNGLRLSSFFLPGRSQDQVKNRFYSVIRTDYLQVRNPYFTKQSQKEAKNELEQARKQHLHLIQNEQKLSSQLFVDNIQDQFSNCFKSPLCFGSGLNPNSEMNLEF